jgi:hypothetical protein
MSNSHNDISFFCFERFNVNAATRCYKGGGGGSAPKPPAPPRPEDALFGATATVKARQATARGFNSTVLTAGLDPAQVNYGPKRPGTLLSKLS